MANFALILSEGTAEPASFGVITATVWVSIAMAIFIAILLWKKVPAMVAGMLDTKIAEISKQLKEAEALRLDAESLKAEYEAKLADAAKEADDMRARADAEAEALVAKAKADATALIARRKQMAEDRIAAAEAGALAEVRSAAAKAATEAAAKLIADKHDAAADKALVDQAIAGVAKG
ncbi:F0F1 ATP synthase subunit B family protein [Sphingopyxis sp. RIFCSPHIGHO2_12_FULL_65_19]|uniref:F0F1 ATP synthase subunit B family protein n=1 Tax=Sphingopyxis sp. RIFCSPHIGHO2_12_FULL_65_19 TaxID=1802172 RepID=UPI0008AB2961|nr:F0F1 ATP synthase subunit B [Sphingopyxis sp. RIFCSPHIGHO2_12_FULL_65_19]OHD06685.1 MAG: F0F1 ATP synthase subunit B [Sphingopyxis sp. RIFCSPHIGHO2_12_FULL_65_19]